MTALIKTTYMITTSVVAITVNIDVGSPTELTVSATENDLMALATAAGRDTWNTDDCRAFAANALAQPIT